MDDLKSYLIAIFIFLLSFPHFIIILYYLLLCLFMRNFHHFCSSFHQSKNMNNTNLLFLQCFYLMLEIQLKSMIALIFIVWHRLLFQKKKWHLNYYIFNFKDYYKNFVDFQTVFHHFHMFKIY